MVEETIAFMFYVNQEIIDEFKLSSNTQNLELNLPIVGYCHFYLNCIKKAWLKRRFEN